MNKPEINQEVYEQYLDATVALFMEHYSAMLTEKVSSEDKDEEVAFPETLDLKCKALIKKEASKQKRLTLWKHTKRTLKAAAVFAIAVLTTFSMLFVSVEAFRIQVINFYIENKNGYWSINGEPDLQQEEIVEETASFDINNPLKGLIPEEYRMISISNADSQRTSAIYENSTSDRIRFFIMPYDVSLRVDSENASTAKEIKILDFDGVLSIKTQTSQVTWHNKETGLMYLIVTNQLSESDLITLAENIAARIHG